MHTDRVQVWFGPQFYLCQGLVGEGVAHDKGWMSLSTTQVHQSPIGKEDHMTAVGEGVPIYLIVMKQITERKKHITEKAPQPCNLRYKAPQYLQLPSNCILHLQTAIHIIYCITYMVSDAIALPTNLGFNLFSVAVVFQPLRINLASKVSNVT